MEGKRIIVSPILNKERIKNLFKFVFKHEIDLNSIKQKEIVVNNLTGVVSGSSDDRYALFISFKIYRTLVCFLYGCTKDSNNEIDSVVVMPTINTSSNSYEVYSELSIRKLFGDDEIKDTDIVSICGENSFYLMKESLTELERFIKSMVKS
jgi:hypothetical protein